MAYSKSVAKRNNYKTVQNSTSRGLTNFKPINLRNVSDYVNKAIELSKNPTGRIALKTILTQYAASTGVEPNVFAEAGIHFIDEIRTKSNMKSAKSTNTIASMIAGFLQ